MASLTNLTIQTSAKIATGNSLQRSAASSGRVRQNSTHGVIEYAGTAWDSSKNPEGIITRGLTVNINGYDTKSYTGSGLTVINSASPGNDATLTSGQVYTSSDPGYFSFNGSTYSTSVPHSSLTSFAGDMTLSCWIYISAYPAGDWVRVVGKGLAAVRNYGLWYHPLGYWLWQRHGTVGLSLQYNGTTLPTQWVQMVGVSRGTTHELYLNGVMVASSTVSSTFNTNTEPLLIGRMADLHSVHNGFVSSVLVYNRGLSAREVLYNYNQQAGRHYKSTITSASPISGSYLSSFSIAGPTTAFNNPGVSFGTEDATRRIAVALSWNAGASGVTVLAANIGSVAATIVQTTAAAGWERSAIIYANVPTGTTGAISVSFSASVATIIYASVYRMVGGTNAVGTAGFAASNAVTTTLTANVSVVAGDYVIGSVGMGTSAGITWTNLTSNYSNTTSMTASHASTTSVGTGTTAFSASSTSSYGVLSVIPFR